MRAFRIAIPLAALGAALFIFGGLIRAADGNFPIYFPNSKLILKAETLNRETYLPLKQILETLAVPYTDALALETLTIRSGNSRLVVTKNSALMSYNDQIVLLPSPVLREDGRWLVPVEFLNAGLTRLTGTEFRYRPGTGRIFADNFDAPQLEMNAQTLGPITRLTIRCSAPLKIEVNKDSQRAVLLIDRYGLDPVREKIDHRDALLRSVAFDDSDGDAKIILEITKEVTDIRVTPAENNRIYFVDLLRKGEPISATPPPAAEPAAPAAKPDIVPAGRRVRVVVIDPGHGGMDTGAKSPMISEKDVTLALARRLRATLQTRLGATVLLTRDSDVSLDNEARSAVANNNQANLFISLHAGYSPNKADTDSSIFVMKENFGEASAASTPVGTRDHLFLPWYLGYRIHRQASLSAANFLQDELTKAIPGSKFLVRSAPLAVLSSATMPSMLIEIGNLNNGTNAQTLTDGGFQNRLANTITDAVQRFSTSPQTAAN
jgi:N-acetylmuramoyl-L-alanine amidase